MIRQAFGIDPELLEEEEWAKLYHQALWLKKLDRRLMSAAVAEAFST